MTSERIDFISAYCDRWCERCAFTDRCSAYACEAAIAMCGDVRAGIELAVGISQPESNLPREPTVGERMLEELAEYEPSAEETAAYEREAEGTRERTEEDPLTTLSWAHVMLGHQWLQNHGDTLAETAGPLLRDALDVVSRDLFFVGAKIHRALTGHDRWTREGDDEGEGPVQNDWNGSAKVALLCLERSTSSWRLIADTTGDAEAQHIAETTARLGAQVAARFPRAMEFVRPGFDWVARD